MKPAASQNLALLPWWECNRHALVSTDDMLKVYAAFYVKTGEALLDRELDALDRIPGSIPQPDELQAVSEHLNILKEHCKRLNLSVTLGVINEYQTSLVSSTSWAEIASCSKHVRMTLISELRSRLFLQIIPHRREFYNSNRGLGPETGKEIIKFEELFAKFPGIRYDISEAGNCFAFERFTACVYHLMRAAEYGLVAVAMSVNVPDGKLTSWDTMIRGIQERMKADESSARKPDNWQDRRKKYAELCSWFSDIKNGWRNPVSHLPRQYSEDDASSMFTATRNMFRHLVGQGFAQVPMPQVAIELPIDTIV